jgi:hypothetical protein
MLTSSAGAIRPPEGRIALEYRPDLDSCQFSWLAPGLESNPPWEARSAELPGHVRRRARAAKRAVIEDLQSFFDSPRLQFQSTYTIN